MPPIQPTPAPPTPSRQVLRFTVQYFKPSGKFYTEGEFTLAVKVLERGSVYMQDVFDHLKQLQAEVSSGGSLPGLLPGAGREFTLYVNHPEGYPGLIPPLVTQS